MTASHRSAAPRSSSSFHWLRRAAPAAIALAVLPLAGAPAATQDRPAADSLATVTITVVHDATPVPAALVRTIDVSPAVGTQTDARGVATMRLPAGERRLVVGRTGYVTDTLLVALRAGQDTAIVARLESRGAELAAVVVSATRGERRVEDTPLRVEVIDEEEIAEKVAMTPGDIAMMLNETGGLRVQPTNPSLGGANVRIQGLRGRYSLLLVDGLPLHGGQAGGLGLLQIPPVDLGRVEIVKGTASALYGSSALGGVVNLVSRRPGDAPERTVLVNRTSRGGTDGVAFLSGPVTERWGYTLLAGAHAQRRDDLDDDGWTDVAGYERLVARPRLYYHDGAGRTAFLTAGVTTEDREGGTMDGGTVPGGGAFEEALGTRRADVGGLARWVLHTDGALGGSIVTVRGSAVEQRHDHRFGPVTEEDRHRTWFGEAAIAVPRLVAGERNVTYVLGVAFQRDGYRNADVPGMGYEHDVPSAFAQVDVDAARWLSISTSARLDAHEVFGTFVDPRVSILLRRGEEGGLAGWSTRLSAGTGAFAPTPVTEETASTGLTPLVLPAAGGLAALEAERARSASLDVGGPVETAIGRLELNATAFGSRVANALQVRPVDGTTTGGASRIALMNSAGPTRTWGGELLARLVHTLGDDEDAGDAHDAEHADDGDAHGDEPPSLRVTLSYTYLRSTECDPDAAAATGCARREVPLTPRHAAGMVASVERHGAYRVGLELYYTGRQRLDRDPYREASIPYLLVGILAERAFETRVGVARLFVNLENLTDVRQTRHDPLLRPERGPGGRWTTDAWTDLTGFSMNAGVRLGF